MEQLLTSMLSALFLLPTCVALASGAILLIQVSLSYLTRSQNNPDTQSEISTHTTRVSTLGGRVIFEYYVVRLLACLMLTALGIVEITVDAEKENVALLCIFVRFPAEAHCSILSKFWSDLFDSISTLVYFN